MATYRILLADDDDLVRFVLATTLEDAGFDVVEAHSGDDAARLVEAGIEPDMLVTDVQMPGRLDGIALARFVRERIPELPVLFVSGRTDLFEEGGHFGEGGAVLGKPYCVDEVVETVWQLIDGRGQARFSPHLRTSNGRSA